MKRAALLLVFLVPLFFISISASAWTRVSDQRIAKKAAALAPADLRTIIERYHSEYQAGLTRPMAVEDSATLRAQIEAETNAAIRSVHARQPMSDLVAHLGILAHLVSDANTPAHGDFEQYFERSQRKFPTVFYGLDANFAVQRYFERTFTRISRLTPLIGIEYARAESSEGFDDRSTAFGVASVCYSHAVTDLVNLYYYIWKEAGGDVRSATAVRRGNLLLNEN
jgi:hypothetical protein